MDSRPFALDRLLRVRAASTGRGRRVRLLAWIQLSIILLCVAALVVVLVVDSSDTPRRTAYVALILGLLVLFIVAYGLNVAGRYTAAAGLTVACSALGPWGSLIVDPSVSRGDLMPLVYVTIPVLLSSLLLPTLVTSALAAFQFTALVVVMMLCPDATLANWPSLLSYVGIASFLTIVASVLSHRDMEQIDEQTRRLALSEAGLREDATRDHLTGLFNRRYLEATLEREVQRAARQQRPLGLIMVDIDHFKRFNDALGHAAGDALLRALGTLLAGQVRLADIACRYGGEEFLLILPEASLEATRQRAERLRHEVKRLHVEHQSQILTTVTVSLGVAVFPDHGSSGEAALKAADAALYRAKREGRDRVVVADRR